MQSVQGHTNTLIVVNQGHLIKFTRSPVQNVLPSQHKMRVKISVGEYMYETLSIAGNILMSSKKRERDSASSSIKIFTRKKTRKGTQ